jgi:hypothetical protein
MRRLPGAALIAMAACGAVIAGCGGSSNNSATGGATQAAAKSSTTPTSPSSSGGGSSPSVSSNPIVQQAVASCKHSISAAPTLSSSEKSKLETVCSNAASDRIGAVKKAVSQVCVEIVKDTVPSADQSGPIAACKAQG